MNPEKIFPYEEIRYSLKVGDMVGFGGRGLFSSTIKAVTGSDLSHVSGVLSTTVADSGIVLLMESTSLGEGEAGVKINRMSDHVKNYDGDIWVYPMNNDFYFNQFNESEYVKFLLAMKGRKYDMPQALLSALDLIPDSIENFERLFCSELMYEAYERGFVVPPDNASEKTPADIGNLFIFGQRFKIK